MAARLAKSTQLFLYSKGVSDLETCMDYFELSEATSQKAFGQTSLVFQF